MIAYDFTYTTDADNTGTVRHGKPPVNGNSIPPSGVKKCLLSTNVQGDGRTRTVTGGRNRFYEALANPMWTPTADVLKKPAGGQKRRRKTQPDVEEASQSMTDTPGILPPKEKEEKKEKEASKDEENKIQAQKTVTVTKALKKSESLRVAAYCRVSTDLQTQENSFDNQRQYYYDLITTTSDWNLVAIFADQGISGTGKTERPGLEEMLQKCRYGEIDLVLCKSISRLARNTTECLKIVRELTDLGVKLHFEKENINTESMGSEFLLTVLAVFAEAESISISGNVKWRIRKQFEEGNYKITHPAYGYVRQGTEYEIQEDPAKVVRFIFASVLCGDGACIIAGKLNDVGIPSPRGGKWSGKSILNILKNPFYRGDALFQKTFADEHFKRKRNDGDRDQFLDENHHVSIISHEDFELANELITSRAVFSRAGEAEDDKNKKNVCNRRLHTLSGLLICPACGSKLARVDDRRYRCTKRAAHVCAAKDVFPADIKNAFATALNKLAFLERASGGRVFLDLQDPGENEARIEEIKRNLIILSGKMVSGVNGDLRAEINRLEAELEELQDDHIFVDNLRRYVNKRGIKESYDDDEAMRGFLNYIIVEDAAEFHFKCGLILKEQLCVPVFGRVERYTMTLRNMRGEE